MCDKDSTGVYISLKRGFADLDEEFFSKFFNFL